MKNVLKKTLASALALVMVMSAFVLPLSAEEEDPCAVGHLYGDTKTQAPTCEADGFQYVVCTRPGCSDTTSEKVPGWKEGDPTPHWEKIENSTISKLGHDYEEGKVITAPTCFTTGTQRDVCKRCGAYINEAPIATLIHTNAAGVELKNCQYLKENPEIEDTVCKYCHNEILNRTDAKESDLHDIDNPNNTLEEIVQAGTSEVDGFIRVVCKTCGEVISEEIDHTAHKLEVVNVDGNVVTKHCTFGKGTADACDYEEVITLDIPDLTLNYSVAAYNEKVDATNDSIVESGLIKVTVTANLVIPTGYEANAADFSVALSTLSFALNYDPSLISFYGKAEVGGKDLFTAIHFGDNNHAIDGEGTTTVTVLLNTDYNKTAKIHNDEVIAVLYFRVNKNATSAFSNEVTMNVLPGAVNIDGAYTGNIIAGESQTLEVVRLGSINEDDQIDQADVFEALKLIAANDYSTVADINKDGKVSAEDYELLANYVATAISYSDMADEGALVIPGLTFDGMAY